MKNLLFSIVIPTLNEELYVPKLLRDLKNQKGAVPFEVLVIDAHSEDNTKKVVENFNSFFPLRVINSPRRNLAFQRNLGVAKAKGEYVILIDADCRLKTNFIRKLEKAISLYRPLVIIPSIIPEMDSYINQTLFQLCNYVIEISQKVGRPVSPGACLIFARSFFTFIGGFEVNTKQDKKLLFPEDIELMRKARKAGVRAYFLKDTLVLFSLRRYKKEGHIKVLTKYFVGIIDMMTNGKLQTSAVPYEMGGQYYLEDDDSQVEKYKKQLRLLRKQLTSFFLE